MPFCNLAINNTFDLMAFFGLDWAVISDGKEFMCFWNSLTLDEMNYYRSVTLA